MRKNLKKKSQGIHQNSIDMYIKTLELQNLRSFKTLKLNFSPDINIILGDNAKGKTTILEAINLLCLARSFRTRSDFEICQFEKLNYNVTGLFISDNNIQKKVSVSFSGFKGRSVAVDGKPILRYSDLIGNFPAVVLSTQDNRITTGPPADRRKFADILLCQLSTAYLATLKEYYRILKQKNQILFNISKGKKVNEEEIEPWNNELVQQGSKIMEERLSLCKELNILLKNVYKNMDEKKSDFEIKYLPNVSFVGENNFFNQFSMAIKKTEKKEKKVGFCLVGPHRDDFLFSINGRDLRHFGSRGEHKTALIALKAAEGKIIYERKHEKPIFILDDLFSELDKKRSSEVLNAFDFGNQILITTTHVDKDEFNLRSEPLIFDFNSQKM